MKTLAEVDKLLREFEGRFGLQVRGATQQSEQWLQMKLGVISASNASRAVAKKGTATRHTYLCELVAEVCTGVVEELNFKQTEWGINHEDSARSSYEFGAGVKFTPLTFVFKNDSFRVGCSTDGLVTLAGAKAPTKPCEIKCPWDSANYIKFLVGEEVKPEWEWQNDFGMWVLEAGEIDVAQYDPRMKAKPLHIVTVPRNPERQKRLNETIPELIHDMDKMLKQIGMEFGSHWSRLAKEQKESA